MRRTIGRLCQRGVNASLPFLRGPGRHGAAAARLKRVLTLAIAVAMGAAACGVATPSLPTAPTAPVASSSAPPSAASAATSPSPDFTQAPPPVSDRVTAFYYLWYGSLANDGAWRHWNQNGHQPPDDVASQYYPERGPYSSRDPAVLAAQMADVRAAGIGVIAVSWWGRGAWDDESLDGLFTAASAAGVKIAFHLEPYTGQTAASAVADIHYLLGRFGTSPALYRAARPTAASPSTAPRPVFYLFAPSRMPAAELKAALGGLRGTADDSIVMIHSPNAISAVRDGGDGIYTYNPMASPDGFAALVADCRADNLICSPCVSPGFDNRQAVATGSQVVDRQNGAHYDAMWQAAVATKPEWIGVVSFDEWHEGTQIEPARDYSGGGRIYTGYEGAFGVTGADAPRAYLSRTAYWVAQFAPAG
jgi:glycoprotein endo-alpha-1,2-mannosidase